jgi:hypothetical protein
LLGLAATAAFVSWWVQMDGLVGSHGLVPAVDQLASIRQRFGDEAPWLAPTLAWLNASDAWLQVFAALGTLCAVALLLGVVPRLAACGVWLFYLSLVNVGGPFSNFQWDALLLETVLMSVFVLPMTRFDPPFADREPLGVGRWLVYWLLFRFMFASGWVKLASGDPTWENLTALRYHYETQPLPNPISYYMHALPEWAQRASCAGMFFIELAVPFLVFVWHPHARRAAFALLAGLQLVIMLTGNYGFFNMLSIALCVPLLDDALLSKLMPARWRSRLERAGFPKLPPRALRRAGLGLALVAMSLGVALWTLLAPGQFSWRYLVCAGGVAWGAVTAYYALEELRRRRARRAKRGKPTSRERELRALRRSTSRGLGSLARGLLLGLSTVAFVGGLSRELAEPARDFAPDLRGFRSLNRYGLFAVMTTERPEIILEGSDDGTNWKPFAFPYKPGALDQAPRWVPPGHMPRLDWQMWFAALGTYRQEPWLIRLMQQLAAGDCRALPVDAAFPGPHPRRVRALVYRYHFTTPDERASTGAWWRRESERLYAPSVQR